MLTLRADHPAAPLRRIDMGFTLLELMLALVVAAVLAAIALPAYHDQVRRSRRVDAITAITQVLQAQERHRANRSSYGERFIVRGGGLAGVGATTNADAAASHLSPGGWYELRLSDVGATGYTIVATAQGSQQADTSCARLQLTLAGGNLAHDSGATSGALHGAASAANRRCWNG
jgi:type IV pilus assembly protein PilE